MNLSDIESQIELAMQADQFALRREWRRLAKSDRSDRSNQRRDRFFARLAQSTELRTSRAAAVPAVTFDKALPIFRKLPEIREALRGRQVIIVSGETGSGKSTQLPKACLAEGFGIKGLIGHTQPRRIAARSVAARVAEELQTPLGQGVGFKVRFADKTNPRTYIKLMTDGVLLAETRSDRFLDAYEVIIVDEAHERSLNIDFLLGYLHRLLHKRTDLRVIITSATIDANRFSEHFADERGPAPIIEVSGRGYPVEIRYRPLEATGEERYVFDGINDAVVELAAERRGDTLVFLPTERDIRIAAKKLRAPLRQLGTEPVEIVPLYARLSSAEQNKIFQPHKQQRIVLATNVAESSLTVPGIHHVVDTGTARISRYAPRSKVQRLPVEAISKASADQRAGRCGRLGPGICIRLYAESDFADRPRFTTPEIRRTNLASVILQTMSLNLGKIEAFPFLDPPRPEAIRDGYKTLFEIVASDERRALTDVGRKLSGWPIDPRIGRMVIEANDQGCLNEVLIIASALELQDPRERPAEKAAVADARHEQFADEQSDFLSLLKVWDFFHERKSDLSRSRLRKACEQNFLSYPRMLEWQDLHRQLLQIVQESGLKPRTRQDDYDAIHRSLLSGLLSGVAMLGDRHEYTGAGGVKFHLWPGSGIFGTEPKWIMAAELVETTRRYGRTAARINPDWIERLAGHLVKRSYSDPHWHLKSESAMAFEKVTLFGLTVVPRRRTGYAKIDPQKCRELLIEHGLVQRELRTHADFQNRNEQLLEELQELVARSRQRDLLIDDYTIYRFYDERLPADVVDGPTLRRYLRQKTYEANHRLTMTQADLNASATDALDPADFPGSLEVAGMNLPLEYCFQPGAANDGVTLTVPEAGLQQLPAARIGWLVPGLLEDRIVAIIRSLPKRLRRNFVPVPNTARQVASSMEFGEGDFHDVLARALSTIAEEPISPADFRLDKLASHLHLNIRVVDESGQEVRSGSMEDVLAKQQAEPHGALTTAVADASWQRDGMRDWDLTEFPAQVEIQRGGFTVPAFPALIDQGDSVGLRLQTTAARAEQLTRAGLTRLCVLQERRELRSQINWLPDSAQWKVLASSAISTRDLEKDLEDVIARRAFVDGRRIPRNVEEFQALFANRIESMSVAAQQVAALMPKLFQAYHDAAVALADVPRNWSAARADMTAQLHALMTPRFLCTTPWAWLEQYPRYLRAIRERIDKLGALGKRDSDYTAELHHYMTQYEQRLAEHDATGQVDPALEEFRWMIEEYRVSLYAQKLGTSVTVSPKRLEKQWSKVL